MESITAFYLTVLPLRDQDCSILDHSQPSAEVDDKQIFDRFKALSLYMSSYYMSPLASRMNFLWLSKRDLQPGHQPQNLILT